VVDLGPPPRPEPDYPDLAREARIEGTVIVRALVGDDGRVVEVLVVESVLGLDEAALAAVQDAVFEPAVQQGRAVGAWVLLAVEFRLFR
jgi:protein TonB